MANNFYNHGSFPTTGSSATSASMRSELDSIASGFDKLPALTGNGNKIVVVNGAGTALTQIANLPASSGGTGYASYTIGDLLYADTTTTLAKLIGVATGNALISGGAGAAPSYGKIGLTTHISGTLPVGNGGTGITSFGTGVATALGVNVGSANAFVVNGGALGTPSSGTLTNATGLPLTSGITGTLAVGNGGTGLTALGTGVVTALGVNVGSAGAFVVDGGVLGTPSSGTLTNATGLPLTSGITGILPVANGGTNLTSFTANGIVYASSTSALTTGSAFTFDGNGAVISVNSTSDGLRITQTGTGNALVVEDDTNPDSTPFLVDATGLTRIGTNAALGSGLNFQLQIGGTSAQDPGIGIAKFATTGNPVLALARSRNTTATLGAIVQNNDVLGLIDFRGDDGSAWRLGARILAEVDGTPGTNDMPGRLVFSTTADGASTPTERMRITSTGALAINGGTSYGTAGQALISAGDAAPVWTDQFLSITYVFSGIGAGDQGDLTIPFNCTITEWTLLADVSGSVVIDIWEDTYANYPPTVADTITGSAKPTISASTKGQSSTLTGWSPTIAAGSTLRFNVDSASTVNRVTLSLKVVRT
jgi:hypothetical protein